MSLSTERLAADLEHDRKVAIKVLKLVTLASSCAAAAFIKCRWAAAPYRKVRQGAAAHLLP
jgi:hypothetical protein